MLLSPVRGSPASLPRYKSEANGLLPVRGKTALHISQQAGYSRALAVSFYCCSIFPANFFKVKMKKTTAEQEISLGFHILCLVVNFLAVKHSFSNEGTWFTFQRYGGRWKYMSHLLMYFNTAYNAYAILVDVYCILCSYTCKPKEEEDEGKDERPMLVQVRDELFNSVAFPFGVVHTLLFAVITMINSGFFVSMINRRKETLSSYHMIHLHIFPFFMCLLESSLVYHKYNNGKKAFQKTGILAGLYVVWLLCVAYFGSYWSYPFLRRAKLLVKVALLAIFPVLTSGCYIVGQKINQKIWITDIERKKAD